MLISSGYSDSAVMLQSAHRESSSHLSYYNLRGKHGQEQLSDIFGKKSDSPSTSKNIEEDDQEDNGLKDKDIKILIKRDPKIKMPVEKKPRLETTVEVNGTTERIAGSSGTLSATNCTINFNISK